MTAWSDNWKNNCIKFKLECFLERNNFLTALHAPQLTQQKVFEDIVNVSRRSQFGADHSVHSVKNISDFKNNIPIRHYEDFVPWLDNEVEAKGGILTSSPIVRWLKTSGSTGNSKKIPYTEHWMKQYRVPALKILFANYLHYCEDMLLHPYATLDTQTIRDQTSEYLNGIPYQGISNRNTLINEFDWEPPWYNAPWFTPDIPVSYDLRMYYRLRYLLVRDLRAILAINPSTVIGLKYHFFKNQRKLIKEIYDGTLFGKKISEKNPLIAKKLEKNSLTSDFSFKNIWPNLSLVVCWTAASAALYLPQLKKLFSEVRILPFMTCGTEGVTTLPIDDFSTTGPLAITQGFYEFLPAEIDIDTSKQNNHTLLYNELELGKEYQLIMSQGNGLCRLAVGDVYKVVDFYGSVPRIEFTRRHGTYHSFTGEKITETQMLLVLEAIYRKYQLDNNLFICSPVWDEPPYYKLLVETPETFKHFGVEKAFAFDADQLLCEMNEEYSAKRKSKRLEGLQVDFVSIGTIDNYHENKKKITNATQFKYKPFQANESVLSEILAASSQTL